MEGILMLLYGKNENNNNGNNFSPMTFYDLKWTKNEIVWYDLVLGEQIHHLQQSLGLRQTHALQSY